MPPLSTLYLDLLKRSLLDMHDDQGMQMAPQSRALPTPRHRCLDRVQACLEACLAAGIVGDLVACGAGCSRAAILMRGVLAAYGVSDRSVLVADTFADLPTPGTSDQPPNAYDLSRRLAGNLGTVMRHFAVYGLLDGQVRFLPGWFADTLPRASLTQVATLCLDGRLSYQDTLDALETLYPRVTPGGYVFVNAWNVEPRWSERWAVMHYRQSHAITDEMTIIDAYCVTWRKREGASV